MYLMPFHLILSVALIKVFNIVGYRYHNQLMRHITSFTEQTDINDCQTIYLQIKAKTSFSWNGFMFIFLRFSMNFIKRPSNEWFLIESFLCFSCSATDGNRIPQPNLVSKYIYIPMYILHFEQNMLKLNLLWNFIICTQTLLNQHLLTYQTTTMFHQMTIYSIAIQILTSINWP